MGERMVTPIAEVDDPLIVSLGRGSHKGRRHAAAARPHVVAASPHGSSFGHMIRPLFSALASLAVIGAAVTDLGAQERLSDPGIFNIGRAAPRASFIPYPTRDGALGGGALGDGNSPYVLSLNGTWKFSWAMGPADSVPSFADPAFSDDSWDALEVPSNWELHGYGVPLYRDSGLPEGQAPSTRPPTSPAPTAGGSTCLPSGRT